MLLEELFEKFVNERIYLKNVTDATVRFYRSSWAITKKFITVKEPTELSKDKLNDLVIAWRKDGQSPKSVNTYISFINAFLTWLHEEGHLPSHLKIKKLRLEQTVFRVFNEGHIRLLLKYQPGTYYEWRLWATLCLILDSGLRINEALSLRDVDVKFDQLLIIVKGKGQKERYVPISDEVRKILYRFMKKRDALKINGGILFPTTLQTQVGQRNFLRDMKIFCKRMKIEGVRVSPHTLRHSYAIWYLVNGGDIYTLSRTLGHSSIAVTEIYLRNMGMEQIQKAHQQFSPLSNRK
jgi:integrase/recombinase XerD